MTDPIPLAVDLDGTLVLTDTLWEGLLEILRRPNSWPKAAPALASALYRGKAEFKHAVAAAAPIDVAALPWREELTAWLRQERANGRTLVLATGAPTHIAQAVSESLGLFDSVLATTGRVNLVGLHKRRALDAAHGTGAWDYIGDSMADIPVWSGARVALSVNPAPQIHRAASAQGVALRTIASQAPATVTTLAKAARVHQWVKNLLIFAPVVLAHRAGFVDDLVKATIAFFAFSLAASATYLFNDLLDLPSDRMHRTKCGRPLASGRLRIADGVRLAAGLAIAAGMLALMLPWSFGLILAGYVVLTLSYSFDLKRRPIVDVMVLAGLYTIRLVAGSMATATELSFWLLAFSMFLFLSLALAKRVTELGRLESDTSKAAGRGYARSDLEPLTAIGAACGTTAVMVFALYLNTTVAVALYPHAKVLWLICPLFLYWVTRLWLYVRRGWIDDDPVVFAIRDRTSLLCLAAGGVVFAFALLPW